MYQYMHSTVYEAMSTMTPKTPVQTCQRSRVMSMQTNKMFDHIRLFFRGLRTHYVETFSFITEHVPATKIKPHLCSRQLLENQKVLRHMHILQSPVCDNCGWIKENKLSFVASLGQSASHTKSPLLGLGTGIQHQCI